MRNTVFACIIAFSACASLPKPKSTPQTIYYFTDDGELEEVEITNLKHPLCESLDYWRTNVLIRDHYYREFIQCDNAREQVIIWTNVTNGETAVTNVTIYERREAATKSPEEYDAEALEKRPPVKTRAYTIVNFARAIFIDAQKTPCNPPDCKVGENYQ